MKIKKMFSYFLIITMSLFYFYACGDEEQPESQPQVTPQKVQEPDTMKARAEEKVKTEKEAAKKAALSKVPETYVVEQGETLTSIAEKFYGDSQKWFHIFALNESDIDDWNKIYYGRTLRLPQFDKTK